MIIHIMFFVRLAEGVYMWNVDFYLWLNEWMSIDKRLSFLLCMSGWARESERESRDKSFSECMCAVLSFFPRTEVWRGVIFLAAVRLGWEAETARGSCFLRGTLTPSNTAFDPAWLPWPANSPPCVCMYECVSAYVYVRRRTHKSGGVIGVVTSGGKLWNKRWNWSGKMKWEEH